MTTAMDAAVRTQLTKRSSDTTKLLTYAFFASRNLPTQKLGANGLDRVQQATVECKRYQDYEMVYHKNCYVTFTSSLHLGRPKKNFEAKKSPCADQEASTSSKNQTLQMHFCQSVSSEKKSELSQLGMFLIESLMQRNMYCEV